jgi:hypothetical protein
MHAEGNSGTVSRMCLGILGTVLALNIVACGNAGVSKGSATVNGGGEGEGVTSGNGTATLIWTPVTQNTDGTLLTDLAGYRVLYGPSVSAMATVVVLPDPNMMTYVVTNLTSGTWYFTVGAYTSAGTQGAMSNVGMKTIN